eukprot:7878724-Ditylum_brightwellii.AAC.1
MLPHFLCGTAGWAVIYSIFVEFLLLVASNKPFMHTFYKSNLGVKLLSFKGCTKTVPINGIHEWKMMRISSMMMCASIDGNCGGND